ncbi:MAG: hypothetical protein E7Z84_04690 [Methanosphaera stadtmanae]|nr:hypothetical protein [Methanosphaera stadtmanae]
MMKIIFYKYATIVVSLILLMILLALLKIYVQNYRKIKVGFTQGLIIFTVIMIIKTVIMMGGTISTFYIDFSPLFTYSDYILVITLIDTIAMSILYRITVAD